MNATFEEWHSGWMIGPRYMAAIFPVLCILVGKLYSSLSTTYKNALLIGLAVAIIFRSVVYATTILAPDVNLWGYLLPKLNGKLYLRLVVFYLLIEFGQYKTKRQA